MSSAPLTAAEVAAFEAARRRLEAIAYRLVGSAAEAEDLVQETFLRWQGADRTQIRVLEAWLTTVLTNLSLTHLTSARARREVYVGQWLPEPLLRGDPMAGPAETAEQRESLSLAVLLLLERLTPQERVVYVLREAFDVPHAEIAEAIGISEAASQQTLRRARTQAAAGQRRVEVDQVAAREVVDQFLHAAASGRTEPLVSALRGDAVCIGDGGGTVPARPTPVHGAEAVARFLTHLFQPSPAKRSLVGGPVDIYRWTANGSPAAVAVVGDRVVGVMTFEVTVEGISAVLNQANPEKLERVTRQWATTTHGDPLVRAW